MRVLFLTDLPPYDGGSGYSASELHNGLIDLGNEVISLAPKYPDRRFGETAKWMRGRCEYFEVEKSRSEQVFGREHDNTYWNGICLTFERKRPDIVITNSGRFAPAGYCLREMYSIPHLAIIRGYPVWELGCTSYGDDNLLFATNALKHANKVIAVSAPLANDLQKYLNIQARVITNAPTNSILENYSCFSGREKDILFVGSLCARKNPLELLAIAKLASQMMSSRISLSMVGGGPLLSECKSYASSISKWVELEFTGFLSRSKVLEEMNRHKVLVLPSHF